MLLTGVNLLMTLVILNLHHHNPNTALPGWLRILAFKCIAKLLCVQKDTKCDNKVSPHCDTAEDKKARNTANDGKHSRNLLHVELPKEVTELCSLLLKQFKKEEIENNYKEEWQMLGAVLDRLCLTFASVATIFVVITIGLVLATNENIIE